MNYLQEVSPPLHPQPHIPSPISTSLQGRKYPSYCVTCNFINHKVPRYEAGLLFKVTIYTSVPNIFLILCFPKVVIDAFLPQGKITQSFFWIRGNFQSFAALACIYRHYSSDVLHCPAQQIYCYCIYSESLGLWTLSIVRNSCEREGDNYSVESLTKS